MWKININKDLEEAQFGNWVRKFYNAKAKNISEKGYEYARWFSTPEKQRQYKFSTISLVHHLQDINFRNCLEVGCGPGTWTKLLLNKYPNAKFTCIDISREMIRQFKNSIKSKRTKTIIANFLDYNFKAKQYDFIFCSRSIDYIPNKQKVIQKFYSLLEKGGKGIIITSPPHRLVFSIKRFFGRKTDKEHSQRISMKEMHSLLREVGFTRINFYPILFKDLFLVPTSFLFKKFYKEKWGLTSKMFASGYIVKFEKPKDEEI